MNFWKIKNEYSAVKQYYIQNILRIEKCQKLVGFMELL